ncbi:MAG: alpha/beta fold hydrolase, partial [Pirellulaceae bacterium]
MKFPMDAIGQSCVGWGLLMSVAGWAWSEEMTGPSQAATIAQPPDRFSLPAPCDPLDSAIAWTDQLFFHQWKIQQHVETNACRLLEGNGHVHAVGTFEQCHGALRSIQHEQRLEPMRGTAVLLLHGLAAPAWSLEFMARHLRKQTEHAVFVVEYASLRSTIDKQAQGLACIIANLQGIEEIHLVGHSMGNIVIRRYLAGDRTACGGWQPDPRVARIVMIAPPNHGSSTAEWLSDNRLFKAVFGESGQQLGVYWDDLEKRLAIPRGEFGIIAGGWGNRLGLNPFLPGDDDGRITVATTRLAGASDFLVVPQVHEFIAHDPRVLDYTVRFLSHGYFIS